MAAAQSVECLPTIKEALDSIPALNNTGMMEHTYKPSTGSLRLDNQKCKVI